jgi:ketosteroid isomerase-like protein
MQRRDFIVGCASGLVTTTVLSGQTEAQSRSSDSSSKAISSLQACRNHEINGDLEQCQKSFHPDALRVEPSTVEPLKGRGAIGQGIQRNLKERRLIYHHYRQPQVVIAGNSAIVVSNYEAGYDCSGKTVEETGKSSNVVLLGSNPVIAAEMLVPNLRAGGYGPLGTALSAPPFGQFPARAVNLANEGKGAGGGVKDALYAEVQRINGAWQTGNVNELLKNANSKGVFLIGDYSPFFVTGNEEIKQHFADFYKTSKVNAIRSVDPTVQLWGDTATVHFNFDLDYILGGKSRRSPGRAVYVFARSGGARAENEPVNRHHAPVNAFLPTPYATIDYALTSCTASHVVVSAVGDPYPTAP